MGILDEAGINVNDVPDDPFGFGAEPWPLEIVKVDNPRISNTGKQYGMMVTFKVMHPDYESMNSLGMGQWWPLPCPSSLVGQLVEPIPAITTNMHIQNWVKLLEVLGFAKDVMGKVEAPDLVGKRLMGKVKAVPNEEYGNYSFRCFGFKAMPAEGSMDGLDHFAKAQAPKGGKVTGGDVSALEAALAKSGK